MAGYDVPCMPGKGEVEAKRIKLIKKILNYGFKAIQFPFMVFAVIFSGQFKFVFKQAADKECSDNITNGQMKSLSNNVESKVYRGNIIAMILLLIFILVDIIMYFKKKRDRKNKKKKQAEENAKKNGNNEEKEEKPLMNNENNEVEGMTKNEQLEENLDKNVVIMQPTNQPIMMQQQPMMMQQQPMMMQQQPMMMNQQPMMMNQQPMMMNQQQQPMMMQQQQQPQTLTINIAPNN